MAVQPGISIRVGISNSIVPGVRRDMVRIRVGVALEWCRIGIEKRDFRS
jgi:hypothetical protein